MTQIRIVFELLLKDESGQDLIEYALVAGLIALGAVAAMSGLATKIGTAFNTVGSQLTSAM
ncbi:Flp family type IVb pilin [Granulicella sibirica]|uniref:Flp/Fap pilin component n=1 Tax=Granulicella sibirica TaxID=2479048 RepID=A0A4Q0SZ41_9BACT|nr:Flp family type IVb pilin [Granulicella sibirica]RXH54336.1 Flp/Fap pilin component [Granulicella sibirica]